MSTAQKNSRKPSSWKLRFFKVTRRFHLYFGLLMWPWVILYGVSAFLFNHSNIGSERITEELPPSVLAQSELAQWPAPEALASEVVKALNKDLGDKPIELIDASSAHYQGDLFVEVEHPEHRYRLRIRNGSGRGTLQTMPGKKNKNKAPFARSRGLLLQSKPAAAITKAAKELVEDMKGESQKARILRSPFLKFRISDGEQNWNVVYRIDRGSVDAKKEQDSGSISFVRFVKRLHLSHGYSESSMAAWSWALLVDLMAFAMVLWAFSGLIMWFQMKNVRTSGLITVLLSVSLAAVSFMAMFQLFTN